MTTLFDTKKFTVHPRAMDGKFTDKSHQRDIDRLRLCCVAEVRRKESAVNRLRQQEELILHLKELLKGKFQSMEEMDRYAKMFS